MLVLARTRRLAALQYTPRTAGGRMVDTFAPIKLKTSKGKKAAAPEEIQLFAWGENDTVHGVFTLDEEGAAAIIATFEEYGNDLAIDYEHQTFAENVTGPVPVAGWIPQGGLFTKEGEGAEGGLFAKVTWTDEAKTLIESKQYRYTSPVFVVESKKGEEGGRVVELLPVALVNYPGTKGMQPLIAAKGVKTRDARSFDRLSVDGAPSFEEIRTMLWRALSSAEPTIAKELGTPYAFADLVEVFDDSAVFSVGGKLFRVGYRIEGSSAVLEGAAVEVARVYTETEGEGSMKLTLKALSLPETMTDAELAEHARRFHAFGARALVLTKTKDLDEASGALEAIILKAGRADELEKQLEKITLSALELEESTLLDEAVKSLKLTPAEAKDLGERPGAKTESGIKWLKGFVAKLSAKQPNEKTGAGKVRAGDTKGAEDGAPRTASAVKLTARQKRLASAAGVTEEEYASSLVRTLSARGRKTGVEETEEDDDGGEPAEKE